MKFTASEVAQHNTRESCWVIINGRVYDVTEFLPEHPGGAAVMLRFGGQDATEEYDPIHSPGTIEKELPPEKHLGEVIPTAEGPQMPKEPPEKQRNGEQDKPGAPPALSLMVGLDDFEKAAERKLPRRAWIYYSSAAESKGTYGHNLIDWTKVGFRPRVLRDVSKADMRRTILGHRSDLPIFISPCALGRLGHSDGERCLVKGAARFNISYAVSMGSSIDPKDLVNCLHEENQGGSLAFQLYVKKDFNEVRQIIQRVKALGFRALMVTVDTPVVGKREEDDRFKAENGLPPLVTASEAEVIPRSPYSSSLNWDDLAWISEEWGNVGPLCLKGLATAEDVKHAADLGFTSLYLSNHGGRQLDGAPSGLHVLLEVRRFYPELLQDCEILLDGGVRRGTDVLKALALGATAVGIGRPFMYALSTHGTDGVCRALEILADEIQTNMRLLGVTSVEQLKPSMLNTRRLEQEIVTTLHDDDGRPEGRGGRHRARI
ncbi:cytochrome B2 [Aspergillus carlsbadensis]|nr:cytochrome B2 [Aspergillus carlsbadensis]